MSSTSSQPQNPVNLDGNLDSYPALQNLTRDSIKDYAWFIRNYHERNSAFQPQITEYTRCSVRKHASSGSNNFAIFIDFSDGVQWVLTIPMNGFESAHSGHGWQVNDAHFFARTASIMMAIEQQKASVPVPKVIWYNSSTQTPLGCPFMIVSRIQGSTLYDVWKDISQNALLSDKQKLERKIRSVVQISRALSQLSTIRGGPIGTPVFNEHGFVADVEPYLTNDKQGLGPYADTRSFIKDRFLASNPPSAAFETVWTHILLDLATSGARDTDFGLYHMDLNDSNIMLHPDGTLAGIIDWEGCALVPDSVGIKSYPRFLYEDWLNASPFAEHPLDMRLECNCASELLKDYRPVQKTRASYFSDHSEENKLRDAWRSTVAELLRNPAMDEESQVSALTYQLSKPTRVQSAKDKSFCTLLLKDIADQIAICDFRPAFYHLMARIVQYDHENNSKPILPQVMDLKVITESGWLSPAILDRFKRCFAKLFYGRELLGGLRPEELALQTLAWFQPSEDAELEDAWAQWERVTGVPPALRMPDLEEREEDAGVLSGASAGVVVVSLGGDVSGEVTQEAEQRTSTPASSIDLLEAGSLEELLRGLQRELTVEYDVRVTSEELRADPAILAHGPPSMRVGGLTESWLESWQGGVPLVTSSVAGIGGSVESSLAGGKRHGNGDIGLAGAGIEFCKGYLREVLGLP